MNFWKYCEEASFYTRTKQYSDSEKLTSLEKETWLFGLDGEESIKIEWVDGNNHKECFVKTVLSPLPVDEFFYYFKVGESVIKLLKEVKDVTFVCTKESCDKVFENYPTVRKFVRTSIIDDFDWHLDRDCVMKEINMSRSNFFSYKGIQKAKEFGKDVDQLFAELSNFRFNTSLLEKQRPILDVSNMPKWSKVALTVGGVILIKVAFKSLGSDIDIQIGDSDFDLDIDSDSDNYTLGDIDANNYLYADNNDLSYNSEITFGAKNFPGFDFQTSGNVDIMGGGGSDTLYVYTKNGQLYASNGNCSPVKLSGHDWVKIGSHCFKVAKIKALI